jgi:antitoxin component of RelBE/YafQ-DinJ toxin-antitoxin module
MWATLMGRITVEIDDDIFQRACRRAEEMGTNIEQLVLAFLNHFVVRNDAAEEFRRLSRDATGNSRGWKFNREEIHDRKFGRE